jgi:hypothetical protein
MTTASPDPEHNASLTNPSSSPADKSLMQLFSETFLMLGRYFIIVYPVFLYFIISSLVIPRTAPDFSHWAWWVVQFGLVAILFIFMSGWNAMMYQAVQEWQVLKQKASESDIQSEVQQVPFRLFKEFIPGMGQYGLPFLVGGFIWLLMVSAIVMLFVWLGVYYVGIPKIFMTILEHSEITQTEIEHLVETLSALEKTQLANWNLILLGLFFSVMIINGLTLFWQQFIIMKQCNPFKAILLSARQAVRHPVKTFIILFCSGFLSVGLTLFSSLSTLTAFFGQFLLILSMVFFGLFMYLYLLQNVDVTPSET